MLSYTTTSIYTSTSNQSASAADFLKLKKFLQLTLIRLNSQQFCMTKIMLIQNQCYFKKTTFPDVQSYDTTFYNWQFQPESSGEGIFSESADLFTISFSILFGNWSNIETLLYRDLRNIKLFNLFKYLTQTEKNILQHHRIVYKMYGIPVDLA